MSRLIKQIPDEWKARNFDEVFEFLPTLTLSRKDLNSDSEFDGIYNIHYGDIHSTYKFVELDFDKEKSIPKIIDDKIDESKLTFLTTGDLVIADASEDYEGVAACVELSNVKDRKVTAGLHTYAVRDKKGYSSEGFRAYILKHPWVNNEVNKIATGSKVYGISKTNISKLKVILPPLPEQQKIASILSKWDELIETQTQLIEEKEKQKKGLMQKLLTGEVRFPGFEEEWEEVRLGDICKKKSSNLSANSLGDNEGQYKVYGATGFLQYTDFYNEDKEFISIVKDGAGVGRVLLCEAKSSVLGTLEVITPKEKVDIFYLYSILQSINFKKYITGSTIPHVYFKDYANEKIRIPGYAEQQEVAKLLFNCDEEIQLLKDELEAIKLQKKGLMQQLLTGKIRVKV